MRHADRNENSKFAPTRISTQAQVDAFLNLMSNPDTIMEGIQGLYHFCNDKRVVLFHHQVSVFVYIFEGISDDTIISAALSLIEKILSFHEPFSSEVCATSLLKILFLHHNNVNSMKSLLHIVDTDLYPASLVIAELRQGDNCTVQSLLELDSPILELNIKFLSHFCLYEDMNGLCDFLEDSLLDNIFILLNSNIRPSIRRACLRFLKNAIRNSVVTELIVYHNQFVSIFLTLPNDLQERILELRIMIIACAKTQNAHKIVISNELIPFVMQGLSFLAKPIENELNMSIQGDVEMAAKDQNEKQKFCLNLSYTIVCYSIDVVNFISSKGKEDTDILHSLGLVELLWQFLNGKFHFSIMVSSISALMTIFVNSQNAQRQNFIDSHFFGLLGDLYSSLPNEKLIQITDNLLLLIDECETKGNQNLIQHIFGTEELMESFSEVCQLSEEVVATKIRIILSKATKEND